MNTQNTNAATSTPTATNADAAVMAAVANAAATTNANQPMVSPTTMKWVKRGGVAVVVVGAGYAAHRFGLLDFIKSKFTGDASSDVSVV